jgi:tetratricopeptide (TPR) repeat protein
MRRHTLSFTAVLLLACADGGERTTRELAAELPAGAQAISLLGEPLYPPELAADVLEDREAKLAQARADYEANSSDAAAIIWLGRRTAYLGRYREAIDIFSEGLERHPGDPRLYRHRGHRYITVRQFDDAIADLERAAQLIAGTEDVIEPDGLPNALNIPTSTLHSNIWYHLGLAHYLKGDLESALRAYRSCIEVSANPDMLVATSHWLYMTLRRLGREGEAATVLEPITADMEVIESHSYHRLLLMYAGELDGEELLEEAVAADAIENATVGYGIANWHAYSGRLKQAEGVLRSILQGPQWAAFGYIAAEADLARANG